MDSFARHSHTCSCLIWPLINLIQKESLIQVTMGRLTIMTSISIMYVLTCKCQSVGHKSVEEVLKCGSLVVWNRVVKSSWLPAKIAVYLVSISWLLCLAVLYIRRFLNRISLDGLLTLTPQPSISKLSDNPAWWKCANIKLGILVPGPTGIRMTLNFSD